MAGDNRFRPLRAVLRNALLWGVGWSALGFAIFTVLKLAGVFTRAAWIDGLGLAFKFGIFGVIAGAGFSSLIRYLYHGRRLSEISWVRVGIIGGVFTGLFVPLLMQLMNVLSGDGMVPWNLVFDDSVWATVFGAVAAGGSLRLAQRAGALAPGRVEDQLDAQRRGVRPKRPVLER